MIYCFLENRSRDITHISILLTKENPERQAWPLIVFLDLSTAIDRELVLKAKSK